MISAIELDAIIPKHLTNRCCQTHTADRRQSQSHNSASSQSGQCHLKKLQVRRFKPGVLANSSVSMLTVGTFLQNHIQCVQYLREVAYARTSPSERPQRNPKQPHKSWHHTATPLECTTLLSRLHARTNVQLQMECLSIR